MFVLYQRQAGHNNNQCHLDMCRGLNPPWCRRMALILSAPHTLHCNRGQRKLSCSLSSHRFWFYQRCIGCFILPQRLGFLHVSINSYTMKTLLFCSSALILSVHRSRSYTGTLWSVSFIDIDFIRWRFLCLGIVLYWFSKGTWFMGALKVDSSNRPTVASARAQLSSLLHWSWFYQQRPRPARDIRALKNFPLRDASGSFLN